MSESTPNSRWTVTPSTVITKKDLAQAVFHSLVVLMMIKRELGLED